ncbi:hypothetical protein EYF80_012442 [Liparis tanakae]|uniref:Uncharacterized protein n=1 Tax=Liparis tanakae TaxID=230148 RepID=A0A4Z2IHL4_9TELE|nr:hypothetical protein EYF80_012442 [Liparis tanakae]
MKRGPAVVTDSIGRTYRASAQKRNKEKTMELHRRESPVADGARRVDTVSKRKHPSPSHRGGGAEPLYDGLEDQSVLGSEYQTTLDTGKLSDHPADPPHCVYGVYGVWQM